MPFEKWAHAAGETEFINAPEFDQVFGWISGSYTHSFLPKEYPFFEICGEKRGMLSSNTSGKMPFLGRKKAILFADGYRIFGQKTPNR